jgi:hypothetical protein
MRRPALVAEHCSNDTRRHDASDGIMAQGNSMQLGAGLSRSHAKLSWARSERFVWLAVLITLTFLTFRSPPIQSDDAFISYRYAYNLVSGHGLVFNTGEYVEGYTNLLWTLLIAVGMALGGEGEALGHWFSVVFAVGAIVGTYVYALSLLQGRARLLAFLAPCGLLASNAFVSWTTSGLETPLFVFLVVSACIALLNGRRYAAAAICFLATLTRPEGAALAACLLCYDPLADLVAIPAARTPRAFLAACGPAFLFAVLLAGLEAWRFWYYGDLLPNTFYAKVGGIPISRGLIYLRNFLVDGPALLLPGACLAAWRMPRFRPAFLFFLLSSAYVVAIGGDTYPLGRFLVPALPMLLAGAIAGAVAVVGRSRLVALALLLALPACMAWSLYGTWPKGWGAPDDDFAWLQAYAAPFPHSAKRRVDRVHYFISPTEDDDVHKELDRWRALRPYPHLVALIGIGKLGYWGAEFRVLDLLGLTDRHIARSTTTPVLGKNTIIVPGHSRTDSAYVLAQKPDLIQVFCGLPLPVADDMCANPELNRNYRFVDGIGFVRNGIATPP